MKKILRRQMRYPKILSLLCVITIAVIVFYEGKNYAPFHDFLISLDYFGTLLGGFFYAYGFTAAPAAAVLLVIAEEQHILLAGLIGGLGALLSDCIIFLFIRNSFIQEIRRLQKEKIFRLLAKGNNRLFGNYQKYVSLILAGFLIASPLPTEIGVTLMVSSRYISAKKFMITAYLLHTAGIFAILFIGSAV